jgi:hypothetical protein
MADKTAQTRMTINVPVARAREYFDASFREPADATFSTAPGDRGTEVTLVARDEKLAYGDLREMLRRAKQMLEAGEIPTNAHRPEQVAAR